MTLPYRPSAYSETVMPAHSDRPDFCCVVCDGAAEVVCSAGTDAGTEVGELRCYDCAASSAAAWQPIGDSVLVLVWEETAVAPPTSDFRGIYREADDDRGQWAHWHTAEEALSVPPEALSVVGGPLAAGGALAR